MAPKPTTGTILCAVFLAGCVSQGTHAQVLAELQAARNAAEESRVQLEDIRTQSASRIGALEEERARLDRDLDASRAAEARLGQALASVHHGLDLALEAQRRWEKDADVLRDENRHTQAKVERLDREREAIQEQYADLERQLRASQHEHREAAKALAEAASQSAVLRHDKEQLARKLRDAERALDDVSQLLAGVDQERKWLEEEKARVERLRSAQEADAARAARMRDELAGALKADVELGVVRIRPAGAGLAVELSSGALFDTGKSRLKPAGLMILKAIGDVLGTMKDRRIRIDAQAGRARAATKITTVPPAGWDLAAARAVNVMRYLVDHAGVNPTTVVAGRYLAGTATGGHDSPSPFDDRITISIEPNGSTDTADSGVR